MNTENENMSFDSAVTSELGSYVYALRDPRDGKIFYVGKAGGREGQGNERVLAHFEEAKVAKSSPLNNRSPKVLKILDIWDNGKEPEWFIVRYKLPNEDTALHVEAALIDILEISQNGATTNIQGGHGARNHGLLNQVDVEALKAEPVNPSKKIKCVFIFSIQRAIEQGLEPYEATRKSWKGIGKFLREKSSDNLDMYAVGVANGISQGAFSISRWKKSNESKNNRWYFDGSAVKEPNDLHQKNYLSVIQKARGYWQRGGYLVVEFEGNGEFKFLRGFSDKAKLFKLQGG